MSRIGRRRKIPGRRCVGRKEPTKSARDRRRPPLDPAEAQACRGGDLARLRQVSTATRKAGTASMPVDEGHQAYAYLVMPRPARRGRRAPDDAAPARPPEGGGPEGDRVSDEELIGATPQIASSTRRMARSYVEGGLARRSPRRCSTVRRERHRPAPTLAIDHTNVGPYIRNTLAADKNSNVNRRCSISIG